MLLTFLIVVILDTTCLYHFKSTTYLQVFKFGLKIRVIWPPKMKSGGSSGCAQLNIISPKTTYKITKKTHILIYWNNDFLKAWSTFFFTHR